MSEPQKPSLVRRFARAALRTATGATLFYALFLGTFYTGRGDKLTKGEKELVTSVFGDEINPDKIRKHMKKDGHITHILRDKVGTVLPPLSHIDIFGPEYWSQDYSQEDARKYGLFIHEATHTWQNQNHVWPFRAFRVYEFTLKQDSRFSDFGAEQQAEIIEAYALRWLHKDGEKNAKTENAERDQLLIKVVETKFPRAQQTRLALQAQRERAKEKPAQKPAPVFKRYP